MEKKIKKNCKKNFWGATFFFQKNFLESQLFWKKVKKKLVKKFFWERHLFSKKNFWSLNFFGKKIKKNLWSDTFFHSAIFIVAVGWSGVPPDQGLIINIINIASGEATTSRALFVHMTPGTMAARPSTPAI